MNKASGTTTRQTLFESLLVYKKAEIKKEYSIIYGNGRIRNLNAFDKITRSISNILGFQKLNELNENLSREAAKLNITNKLKGNLFESKETLTNIRNTIQRAWNLDTATQNFFEKMNDQIKEKKIEKTPPEKSIQRSQNKSQEVEKRDGDNSNNEIEYFENEMNEKYGHYSELLIATLANPSIEKLVIALVEKEEKSQASFNSQNPAMLIAKATEAAKIKKSLGCSSEQAIDHVQKLAKLKNIQTNGYVNPKELESRVDNFILVKNKYKLNEVTAIVYAFFLEHLKEIDKNIVVDDAFKIIKLALDSKEIGTADRQEFIANPKEGLKAAYEKYNFNYNKKLALQFINSKNEKKSEVQKNKIAAEMANPAYSVIKAMEYRFQAATKIFADSKDKGNKTDQSMNQLRPSIIEEYKNIESNEARINEQRDKGIDANGNYDPSLDKNYYQQF